MMTGQVSTILSMQLKIQGKELNNVSIYLVEIADKSQKRSATENYETLSERKKISN